MLEIKIMNGSKVIKRLGIKILVKIKGIKILTSIFLKNSISSKRLRIIPKQ
tara:strand:+ start:341 stop:493 length:153 start_codon:yes stop_codon:yes gene_type:complete